ncbi:MAG: hypothetical protein Q9173_002552 [Seirophora scorigena]
MQARDENISVINEALQGIRQIKMSASEQQWLAEIRWKRNRELEKQLYRFILRTALVGIWAFDRTYSSARSSFTIGGFHQHRGLRADRAIACDYSEVGHANAGGRRERREDRPVSHGTRLMTYMQHGGAVSLLETSICWPTAEPKDRSGGIFLRGINVTFPPGKLSIISGKTGSGKSLLLAAIVGEGEKLSGAITAPACASTAIDSSITPASWIIPGVTAFVAQVPWIENLSIRDKILFGLCFEITRYRKVLAAGALTKDLGE